MIAPLPIDEVERLETLRQYEILDTDPEPEFDDLTHLAALICGTPFSAITLIDKDRQWFKSHHGFELTETSRDVSFCSHAILEEGVFLIPDASDDERFSDNILVTAEPHIRFYAGVPLISPEGYAVGALCVIDTVPRQLNSDQQDALVRLGHQAISLLEARPDETEDQHKTRYERQQARRQQEALAEAKVRRDAEELKASEIRYRRLFEAAKDGILILDAATGHVEDANPFLCQLLGYESCEFTGKKLWKIAAFQSIAATPSAFRSLRMSEYLRYEDLELETKTGQRVFVDFVSNIYECAGKKVIQCNLRDISAEKQAVTEQERFFTLALDMLCILDVEGNFERVNPALERVLGFSPNEMLGKQCMGFVHPDDWAASKVAMAQLADGQSVINFVNRFRCRDNSYKSILWVASPYEDQIYAAGRDITNHIQAEETAQASQRFLQATLDSLSEQIAVLDEKGTILAVNKAWLSSVDGIEEAASTCGIGVNYIEVCDKANGDSSDETLNVAQGIRDVMVGRKTSFSLEYPCHRSDEQRWFNVCVTRFINNGSVHAVVAHENISKRKRAEIALHKSNDELELHVMERTCQLVKANEQLESELVERRRTGRELRDAQQMLQLVMNHIPQAIFWKDQSSTFLGCNHRFALDAGYSSPEEVKGKNDFDMPSAAYAVDYISDDRFVMETDTPKLNIEEKLYKGDGSSIWLRTSKIPLHDSDDNVVGVLCSYEDITEWKEAETSIIEARQEADAANHAKSEFLSRMSHELRTPLNAILGFGQILDRAELPSHLKESVSYILKGGWHLLGLINEVLDIARVEAGRLELALEPVLLSEIVSETCSMMRPLASERRIYLKEETVELESRYIMADPQRLKQVLLNLIGNAIKYNRDDGLVAVSCQQSSTGWITISVHDTGQGIASHDLPKLFSPFERLNATSTKIEGTGLGLVLSKRLMEAMGGTLSVESTYGVGTTFTIELEQADLPEEMAVSTLNGTPPLVFSKEAERPHTVLCIEDNPSNLRLTASIFRLRPQWKLLATVKGDIGLSMARQYKPDVILLDLNLPEMDGREVLKTLRRVEATRHIPVVIISADATPNQVEQLLIDGANAYLTKPLDVTRFLQTLDELLVSPITDEQGTDMILHMVSEL